MFKVAALAASIAVVHGCTIDEVQAATQSMSTCQSGAAGSVESICGCIAPLKEMYSGCSAEMQLALDQVMASSAALCSGFSTDGSSDESSAPDGSVGSSDSDDSSFSGDGSSDESSAPDGSVGSSDSDDSNESCDVFGISDAMTTYASCAQDAIAQPNMLEASCKCLEPYAKAVSSCADTPGMEGAVETFSQLKGQLGCSDSGKDCGVCVIGFAAAGGCKAATEDEMNAAVPAGCDHCGAQAQAHCGFSDGSSDGSSDSDESVGSSDSDDSSFSDGSSDGSSDSDESVGSSDSDDSSSVGQGPDVEIDIEGGMEKMMEVLCPLITAMGSCVTSSTSFKDILTGECKIDIGIDEAELANMDKGMETFEKMCECIAKPDAPQCKDNGFPGQGRRLVEGLSVHTGFARRLNDMPEGLPDFLDCSKPKCVLRVAKSFEDLGICMSSALKKIDFSKLGPGSEQMTGPIQMMQEIYPKMGEIMKFPCKKNVVGQKCTDVFKNIQGDDEPTCGEIAEAGCCVPEMLDFMKMTKDMEIPLEDMGTDGASDDLPGDDTPDVTSLYKNCLMTIPPPCALINSQVSKVSVPLNLDYDKLDKLDGAKKEELVAALLKDMVAAAPDTSLEWAGFTKDAAGKVIVNVVTKESKDADSLVSAVSSQSMTESLAVLKSDPATADSATLTANTATTTKEKTGLVDEKDLDYEEDATDSNGAAVLTPTAAFLATLFAL